MAILAVMLVGLVAIWIRSRRLNSDRAGGRLPRTPDTVAAVWSYVCASVMLEDFAGLGALEGKERDGWVEGWGRRYGMRWDCGVDGVGRWRVDYEGG